MSPFTKTTLKRNFLFFSFFEKSKKRKEKLKNDLQYCIQVVQLPKNYYYECSNPLSKKAVDFNCLSSSTVLSFGFL